MTQRSRAQRLVFLFASTVLAAAGVPASAVDGRPVLDARLASDTGSDSSVGFTRLIADDDHFVQVMVLGPEAKEKALKAMHERLIDGLRFP
ncbi:hypothetical protein ACFYYM_17995 [Streptomyces erythrochromogenes]|uniref:hypothetical protein n=1 Tax=Streptomyces erythrochromogenes TaxID=285574 RepID=UPI00368EB7E7